MATPKLFVGNRDGYGMFEMDRGYLDRTVPYNMLLTTDRLAPAGPGGEAIFTSFYLVVTYQASIKLYVTAIVDGVALERQEVSLVQNGAFTRQTVVRELGISVPLIVGGIERARQAARGTWIQAKVETDFDNVTRIPTQVIIEGIEIENEIVREQKQPGVA